MRFSPLDLAAPWEYGRFLRILKAVSTFEMSHDLLGTVRRALRGLAFLAERGPATPRAIAAAVEANLSTVYHVLNTLAADGYAARDEATGAYTLGRKAARLSDAYVRALPVTPDLRAILYRLAEATSESAYLALLHDRAVVIAEIVESKQHVRVASLYPGYAENLQARALGKAVLAHCDPAFVREHFRASPPLRITPATLTEPGAIEAELTRARARGFAEDVEEFAPGVCCIAAPFFSGDGAIFGALSVAIPSFRFRAARSAARAAVVSAAAAATTALTGNVRRYNRG
jgi:IclR family acetate operon transcriptional repressor